MPPSIPLSLCDPTPLTHSRYHALAQLRHSPLITSLSHFWPVPGGRRIGKGERPWSLTVVDDGSYCCPSPVVRLRCLPANSRALFRALSVVGCWGLVACCTLGASHELHCRILAPRWSTRAQVLSLPRWRQVLGKRLDHKPEAAVHACICTPAATSSGACFAYAPLRMGFLLRVWGSNWEWADCGDGPLSAACFWTALRNASAGWLQGRGTLSGNGPVPAAGR